MTVFCYCALAYILSDRLYTFLLKITVHNIGLGCYKGLAIFGSMDSETFAVVEVVGSQHILLTTKLVLAYMQLKGKSTLLLKSVFKQKGSIG